ncbi:hypothetical protein Lepto7376_1110 [[Leptolyngbya] sp. PCC 7376]|uniref:Hfq-related RNA-binding protein n=1 Tax=[Leptolyngbya] sp. PCC 7376 TaxID=111781 RepID=UPI00029EEE13|nr:hypothetical protein [[Leptolyngbya] sp. PCC 7376]AFY37478.1 hypothetical protein Lepto7376_1110 [[Leptolyngbya] sp. PCC 7376]
MTDFNTGYPSVRKIQTCIKDSTQTEIKLLTNDVLVGKLLWQDPYCVCLVDAEDKQVIVSRQAIAYLKAQT